MISVLTFSIILLALACHGDASCRSKCRFRLCQAAKPHMSLPTSPQVVIRSEESGFPFVCLPGRRIGSILEVGPAKLEKRKKRRFKPPQKDKNAPGLFNLTSIPLSNDSQGITTSGLNRRLYKRLNGLCVELPIVKYELVRKRKNKTAVIDRTKSKDCVSFEARAPDLIVDLNWDKIDNLDLDVKGPSKGEKVIADGPSGCRGGQETIVIDKARTGKYAISVKFSDMDLKLGNKLKALEPTKGPGETETCFRGWWFITRCNTASRFDPVPLPKGPKVPVPENGPPLQVIVTVTWKGNRTEIASISIDRYGCGLIAEFEIRCNARSCIKL